MPSARRATRPSELANYKFQRFTLSSILIISSIPLVSPLPNDNPEFTRLNLQHYQVRFLLHGLHMAPVHETLKRGGARVLDAGCGTGIWSIEMAQKYPESEFVASDLINVFTQSVTKAPPNLRFDLSNTLELPYSDGQFDYVFQRFQAVCFKEEEWPRVIKELTRVLKPGGWLELSKLCHHFSFFLFSFHPSLYFRNAELMNWVIISFITQLLCTFKSRYGWLDKK